MNSRRGTVKTVGIAYRWFVGATIVAGVGVLTGLSGGIVVDSTIESASNLLLWMLMITIAATSPVPLPRSSATTTLIPVLDVAGLVLFGPTLGIGFAVLGRLVGYFAERSQALVFHLSDMGRCVLSIFAAGVAYIALGGRFGSGAVVGPHALAALAGAAATYWVVRTAHGTVDAALRPDHGAGRGATGPVATYLGEQAVVDAVLVPFGVLLATTQIRMGLVGVTLFLVPMLLGRYLYKHWVEGKRAQTKLVRTLMGALDASDPFTRGHSYRIAAMSVRVGRHLGMSRRELDELELAALLHDVGRAAIRHEIRLKPGRLTRQEQTQLQAHPQIGHDLLAELPSLSGAAQIVLAHHEQPDGKGYPRALQAGQIPLGSRIIMAVAAFDAMTSDRPYRQGLPPQAAFDELLAHSGTQFFAEVVEALIHLHSSGALFEDFATEQLEEYADGRGNSRALEEYARSRATKPAVPEKLGLDTGIDATMERPGIPMLELPDTTGDTELVRGRAAADEADDESDEELEAPEAWQGVNLEAREGASALRVFAVTDVGCTRKNNEDCYGVFAGDAATGDCLVVLADGMGGAASGEVASRLAVATVAREFKKSGKRGASPRVLARALEVANHAIHRRAGADSAHQGMGTTCTAAWWSEGAWQWAHVGDSRAYLVKDGVIEQLTKDHTLGVELEGRQVANEGAVSSAHHVLTRNLGASESVVVDTSGSPLALEPGAALVLCSDGLSNLVEDTEIGEIVAGEDPEEACRSLVELARARGGPDNITVVIAKAA